VSAIKKRPTKKHATTFTPQPVAKRNAKIVAAKNARSSVSAVQEIFTALIKPAK
jgi:hypothetical protein